MLAGAIVLVALAATGLLVGATVGARSAPELLLSAYVAAFTEIVAVSLFLSAFDSLTRTSLIAATFVLLAATGAIWVLAGTPRFAFPERRAIGEAWRPWPVRAVTAVVGAAVTYVVALIVGTAPNGWDPLNYHLARAAFWLESGHVGYVRHAYDQRLNFNPPNGEIGLSFALGVTHDESAAGFIQFFAALACSVAAFMLARRFGLSRAEAAFGALLLLTLPIVLLQSSGAKNDVVVASFVLAACVFVLGSSRLSVVLTGLATALAVGTKFTAAYGLPILVALALIGPPRTWRVRQLVSIALGAVAGAYWYVVNAVETGRLLGDQSNAGNLTAPLHAKENLLEAYGLLVDTLDLSGAQGTDLLLYLAAAVVLTVGLTLAARRSREATRWAVVAGALVASPLLLLAASTEVGRPTLVRLYDFLGKPEGYLAVGDAVASSPRTASDTASWFGPLGFLLVVGVGVGVLLRARRGLGAAAAVVPIAWFLLVSLTLTYHPWQGRFFIVPVALSASLWGLALRKPALAWSVVAIAAVTALLSLDHFAEKPSGLRLLDRTATHSVWYLHRWQVQSQHDPALAPVYRYVDEQVPPSDSIALALGPNEFAFPFFGPHLERRVELVPSGSDGHAVSTRWLFADSERADSIDTACWRPALRSERGTVFRRTGACG